MGAKQQDRTLYLGCEYDVEAGQLTNRPVTYDPRHLTTHAVILGMTGSGKTGLGMIMLEESLLQGVPALILDPKGDIVNLLLTFPDLAPGDFAPWVDLDGARRRGMSAQDFAVVEAEKWREGLAQWGISGERIAQLREEVSFSIFTPGSEAGQPVDVLHFFDTPQVEWEAHEEALRERIGGIVSALLGLVGVSADPLQSPEHILLARLIEHVWRAGEPLDLPTLIRLLQEPPFQQVGVFELETFFPQKKRFELARQLNNLIAAPGFETWQEGTPLDVGRLFYDEEGRPRASIFYLAHLDDSQRMFFITLFLEAVRDWLRAQSGTADLRALLYFDEVYGYFPPYPANPPTKAPLMALVKQGRAAGLGVVLSTQNPADLDYKGLTNAGTWAVGTLRTERDKDRVLEGLEGASATAGEGFDRRTLDRALGSLQPRVFLLHDIHAGRPLFFHTRWAMSYLRGPLTRQQVRQLASALPPVELAGAPEAGASAPSAPAEARAKEPLRAAAAPAQPAPEDASLTPNPPTLPPDVPQVFLPPAVTVEWALRTYEERHGRAVLMREHHLVHAPYLLALGTVRTVDRKRDVDHQQMVARLVRPQEHTAFVDWDRGEATVDERELSSRPTGRGVYEAVPATLARPDDLRRLEKEFSDYLYRNVSVEIWYNAHLDLYGRVGESRRDFRVRCERVAREARDAELAKARAGFDKKIDRLRQRIRREQRELNEDEADLDARKREELLGLGESALNLLTGRRPSYMISSVGRKRRMTQQARADVEESLQAIEDLEAQIQVLEEQWQAQADEINARWGEKLEEVGTFEVTPRRVDVMVQFCGLGWVPEWHLTLEGGETLSLPAREVPA